MRRSVSGTENMSDGIEKPGSLKEVPKYVCKKIGGFFSRLFYIFALVWKSAPFMFILMMLFCILNGVLPVAGAYISSELLNVIAELIADVSDNKVAGDVFTVMKPLVLLFAMNIIYLFLNRLINKLSFIVTGIAGELVINHIKLSIAEKAKTLDMRSFDTPEFYEKLENANREANIRPISILNATFSLVSAVISAVSFVVVLSTLNMYAPLVILAASIPGAVVSLIYRNRNFRYVRFHSKERLQMQYFSSLMVDKDRVGEIKILGLGDTFIGKYKAAFGKYYKGLKNLILKEGATQVIVGLIATLVNSALLGFIAYSIIFEGGKVGDFSLYSGALTSIVTYISTLMTATVTIYEGTLFIDNMIEYMKEKPEIVPNTDTPIVPLRDMPHTIELVNVSFRYPGTTRDVLKNVNLRIDHAESVVLVGLNGAGKSTLIKLITRLYDPTEGHIYLDGRDIREYDVAKLHDMFGIIFQNFGKYADTIKENIRYGDVDAECDDDDIIIASRRGGADEFISALPDKYDTPLTRMFFNNGIEPSGGQWQKLSVARAFFKDSEILILDEPTASLDPLAEQEVFEQFSRLSRNKTAIFVSHKLSSAVSADKIVVIDNGEICEVGDHKELMELGGKYYDLFSTQARRYADIEE